MPQRYCRRILMIAVLLCASAGCAQSKNPQTAPLTKVGDVPLPGAAVRFDYQSFDPSQGRLYIAHMNANQLVVFDVTKREVVANLDGFPSVHFDDGAVPKQRGQVERGQGPLVGRNIKPQSSVRPARSSEAAG